MATTSICQPTTAGCTMLPAKHHRPTDFLVGVKFVAGLFAWSCC